MHPTSKRLTENAVKGTGMATLINNKPFKNKSMFVQSNVKQNKTETEIAKLNVNRFLSSSQTKDSYCILH